MLQPVDEEEAEGEYDPEEAEYLRGHSAGGEEGKGLGLRSSSALTYTKEVIF